MEIKAVLKALAQKVTYLIDAMDQSTAINIFEQNAKMLNIDYAILSCEKVVIIV